VPDIGVRLRRVIRHEQVVFRAELWKKFVAEYQTVLAAGPETFSEYCSQFRKRWIVARKVEKYEPTPE
jgi:hypothetical protein